MSCAAAFAPAQARPLAARPARRSVRVQAGWTSTGVKQSELASNGGKKVVELDGQRILLAEVDGAVKAVSNKCSHLGLPLVGKTAMFQADISNGCVTCPAHLTKFDLTTGQPVGEWCPKMPNLPLVGKLGDPKPLPVFQSRVSESGVIEVNV
ncbi:ferredoxin component [Chlorella sorokiniana]|uniref:Ferredoxin component n=1 Tax=Chlorella sorokiniana TaxID=3076 RepID=A0A2P6TCT5_CHLSO|nr:ferredoxin component [Chlorella sorokiniana]|eukprot:PRW20446.1 ferredoxin component [Chlorella sorokiniana]